MESNLKENDYLKSDKLSHQQPLIIKSKSNKSKLIIINQ